LNGTATNDRVFGLAGNDKIFASAGADVLYGGAGNDHLDGGLGSDKLIGGLGDDTYYVDSVGDVIEELIEEGIDTVITALGGFTLGPELENLTLIGNSNSGAGNELANRLTGNYVSNVLVGGNGDDWLNGASGNDNLQGGSDNDTYVFGSGFGKDVVFDSVGMADSVEIVGNIASADIALSRNVNDLVLQLPQASDQLILTNWYLPDSRIETINFADGSILDAVAIEQLVVDINLNAQDDSAAVVEDIALFANGNVLINDENGTVAGLLAVTNPGQYVGAYGQLNLGADGGYLYQLNNTSEFVQSLAKGQIVVENFKYTITESNKPNVRNGEATLRISIEGSNDAPLTIPDSAELREDLITSVQGNVLANDSDIDNGAALTVKNPGSYTGLYGTFTLDSSGGYSYSLNNSAIEVQSLGANTFVTDTVAYSITDGIEDSSSVLSVQIQGDNDVPMLAQSISDQSGSENQAFRFELPVNTFSDFDNDDVVSITATFADSKPLPSWLEFNTATRVFSGTPTIGSAGVLDIKVIGTDTGGLSASDVFTLTIGNTVDHDHQIIGTHGVDRLEGSKHKDWIEGLGDRDWLYGKRGNDTLWGGDGNDSLDGGSGDDRLFGEVGNDRLLGKQGNDFLDGGLGADVLIGGEGDDYFVVDSAGDIIWESHHEGEDTVASAITYKLSENLENLILTGNAAINGIGNAQNNQLEGNIGGNILNGGSGNDFLDGKEGNDILIGGNGNDTYLFGLGYGTDTVSEHHSRASNSDSTQFLPGISADQLWFRHVSNNLEVSIFGTNDKLVIQDWYLGAENHVEWFKIADNKTLSENNVQKLVDAMANLDPSTTGDIVLPLDYHAIYAPVIATYWQ
ncbi:MAG: VCBS domain-containing protein, partial [Methylococcales bacterium]